MSALVSLACEQGVATITLDAPLRANAINLAMAEGLRDAVRQCHEDGGVRAVLIQASGKIFCAGGDLNEFGRERGDRRLAIETIAHRFHEAENLLLKLEVPIVTAVQGAAAGAGLTLALLGDVILASEHATFVPAFTRLGLSADGGSTWVLPRLIGARRATEWLLTGEALAADQALTLGLVSEVCDAEALPERAMEIARRFATGPTPAFRSIKRLIGQSPQSDFATQATREAQAIAHHAETSNGEEGVAAVLERREPCFTDAPDASSQSPERHLTAEEMRIDAHLWIAAWNRRDLRTVIESFSQDAVFSSPLAKDFAGSAILRGREAIATYWTNALSQISHLYFSLTAVTCDVQKQILVIHYEAEIDQRRIQACEVVEFRDGQKVSGKALYGADMP